MNRRDLLRAAALAIPAVGFSSPVKINRGRISTITDENAKSPAEAIAFAKTYDLRWVELRGVPGAKRHYADLTPEELRAAAAEFRGAGLQVSFFNSGQCKYLLPGTTPSRPFKGTPEQAAKAAAREQSLFDKRVETLQRSIRAAQALGTDKVRIFTFIRTATPEADRQRIVDVIGELVKIAEKEGAKLLLENEVACNVARCDELAAYMKAIPSKSFGINWDPLNGVHMKEPIFPDAYAMLPKEKIWNVQIKGKSILKQYDDWMDWARIFAALEQDGYRDQIGLECHIFGEQQIAKSHEAMKEILRIAEQRS